MISCPACGNENPIGTRYCRRCGAKVEVKQEQIVHSVTVVQADATAQRWYSRGHSMLVLGGVILVGALILRFGVVPAMPPADIIPVDPGSVIPEHQVIVAPPPPPVAATMPATMPKSATAAPAAKSATMPAPATAAAPAMKSATAPAPATAAAPAMKSATAPAPATGSRP